MGDAGVFCDVSLLKERIATRIAMIARDNAEVYADIVLASVHAQGGFLIHLSQSQTKI